MKTGDICNVSRRMCGLLGLIAALSLSVVSCTQKVEMKPIDPTAGMNKDDVALVKEHLEKAGVKGEVMKMDDLAPGEDAWLVLINMAGAPEPGKRPAMSPPKSYRVYKSTGQVVPGG